MNFIMKTKGDDDSDCGTDDIFFVEIKLMEGEYEEMAVTRFCMVEPNDNGILHPYIRLNIVEIRFASPRIELFC